MKATKQDLYLCWSSGLLLALSYPRVSFFPLAWFALVPLLLSLARASSLRETLFRTAAAGSVFFLIGLSWLRFVTFFGWIFVALFETCFFFLLGFFFYQAFKIKNFFLRLLGLSSAWMAVEIVRSELPVFGLGWNLLAYSQTPWLEMLQFAGVAGAYGLGFLMFAVNVLIFEFVRALREKGAYSGLSPRLLLGRSGFPLLSAVILAGALWVYGFLTIQKDNPQEADSIRVSVVQGNIPQSVKWEVMAREQIIQIYTKLTELASYDVPHLILWPEASFPGFFNVDGEAARVNDIVRKVETPVVLGAPYYESRKRVFNSAYLLGSDGSVQKTHHKLKLVPFGEYVPLGQALSWLEPIAETLGVSDFSPGKELTVFELEKPKIPFSVLVCFEDAFPRLARSFAEKGIRFFAVMTNDAWFGVSGAPYQHLQASVFRAVENGLPLVRAANTGVSAVISKRGEILGQVEKDGRGTFVTGFKTVSVPLEETRTLYRRGGWAVPYLVSLIAALFFFALHLRTQRKSD